MRSDGLVGRSAEVLALEDAVDDARAGRGRLVVVDGPAGIGRSALLRAAGDIAASRGVTVLAAGGRDLEATHALALARRLLGPAAAGDEGSLDHAIAGLLDVVSTLTEPVDDGSRPRPLLLAVDDLQSADPPSARFLATLAGRLDDLPVALVVAVRPGERPDLDPLVDSALGNDHAVRLQPRPLDAGAVGAVLAGHLGRPAAPALARAVHEVAGGMPFAVHATARDLAAVPDPRPETVSALLPDDVSRVVAARLARLGPEARRLAAALAVLGSGAPMRLVADLAELPGPRADEVADALVAAGLLAPRQTLRFAYPLVARAIEACQSDFATSRRHRRAADLLAADAAAPQQVGALLMRARPEADATVVARLRAAAVAAAHHGDPKAAVQFLQRACDEPPDDDVRVDVALELLEARAQAADETLLDDLEALLAELQPGRERARALTAAATLAHHVVDLSVAVDLAQRGMDELPPDERADSDVHAQWVGSRYLHPAHHRAATAVIRDVIARARDGHPPASPSLAALAAVDATYTEPDAVVRRLADIAFSRDPLVDADTSGTALGYAAAALVWTDALPEATARMDAAVERARHGGALVARTIAHHWRGIAAFHEGRLQDALADAEHAAALQEQGWTDSGWSTPLLIDVYLARGELDRAREHVGRGERMNPERPDFLQLREARARVRLAENDADAALADVLVVGETLEHTFGRDGPRAFAWRLIAAQACRALGDREQARGHAARAVELLRPLGTPRQTAEALTELAACSDDEEALGLLEEALGLLEHSTARLARGRALLGLGRTLGQLGRRDESREPLFGAFELADQAGAAPLAAEARRALNALGHRPRRAARAGLASLTPGERRVVELASAGLSNPEIAHHLVISRRTVETHLARAYRKLAVGGRRELAEVLGS